MAEGEFSECALALLRYHFTRFSLLMGASNSESLPGFTLEETRAAYDELVAAGFVIAVNTMAPEKGVRYWLTLAAMERKTEWLGAPPSSRRPAL
jgi:hypothetical protein